MSAILIDNLIEMGFSRERAQLAIDKTQTTDMTTITEWLFTHEEEPAASSEQAQPSSEQPPAAEGQQAKSIKCEDCGKLFKNQDEVEYHATKSGHGNFAESTEEKKPLTDEEKKEQLARIEEKLRERRMQREAREKEEALEKERNRIRSGKEMLEAKKKHEELEMKKILEQRKREKEEEKQARQKVRDMIEQDKLARKAKQAPPQEVVPVAVAPPAAPKAAQSYDEITLQIKMTNGSSLTQTFGAKEPLSAVKLYVEMNRKDEGGPFNLLTICPRKVFTLEEYDAPLHTLGLGPRAILHVSKA